MVSTSAQSPVNPSSIRKVRKAVLPAAGLGTRFLPATKAQPKEMLVVVDKPQIQYVAEECVASGIEHIIIVTGKGKNSIEDHFDYAPTLERFLEEKGKDEICKDFGVDREYLRVLLHRAKERFRLSFQQGLPSLPGRPAPGPAR